MVAMADPNKSAAKATVLGASAAQKADKNRLFSRVGGIDVATLRPPPPPAENS